MSNNCGSNDNIGIWILLLLIFCSGNKNMLGGLWGGSNCCDCCPDDCCHHHHHHHHKHHKKCYCMPSCCYNPCNQCNPCNNGGLFGNGSFIFIILALMFLCKDNNNTGCCNNNVDCIDCCVDQVQ